MWDGPETRNLLPVHSTIGGTKLHTAIEMLSGLLNLGCGEFK